MVKKIRDDGADSRRRILEAARAEFSEKGFDGARVDEISRRAEVNKALIYYYFGSKQKLLEELLKDFLHKRRQERTEELAPDRDCDRDLPDRVAIQDLDFLERHRDILRVVLMEDIKAAASKDGKMVLFEHWLDGLAEGGEFYRQRGYPFRYTPRVVAALYFQHMVPSLVFSALGESIARNLGIEYARLREEFLKLSTELVHSQYVSVFDGSNRDPAPEVPRVDSAPKDDPRGVRNPPSHVSFAPSEKEALLAKILVDGRVRKFPLQEKARVALVEHLSGFFQAGRTYAEREVNEILKSVVDDHTKARRYLVDYGYLDRKSDGSAYWVP